ncbi:MAG: tRNA uridine-5-carboxymethylaminomethyl(34) synthesis GTPase MnmE [Candidatus Omnitrophica bacterium]|nr:tRNA uridine-5-carboxymethylaminomethyl(34) synthesis GTPase MnmE [Candidatus Omnitrophota bacterium]
MKFDRLEDTIAAISTPLGKSGIGIVRISGKSALKIADRIFLSKDRKKPSSFKTYTTHYGWIVEDIDKPDSFVDEVILTVMRAPRSYTKEDTVEINCHGGILPLKKTLELVLKNGARLAEPGEFTKRAFLNGRIDLNQAEAVLEVIEAKTELALKAGIKQLKGEFSYRIKNIRKAILDILVKLEANIDFSEEEIGKVNLEEIRNNLEKLISDLAKLLRDAKDAKIFREGLKIVICGRANVGKSSLLNALLREERCIVTPIPGTTRDTIEEIIDIRGLPVRIVDTAGILEPNDLIEKKALQRTKRAILEANLIILVFDGSERLKREDLFLIGKLKRKPILAVINKIDLPQKIEKDKLSKYFNCLVEISAKKLKNIDRLEEKIVQFVYEGKTSDQEPIFIPRIRHIQVLKKILYFIKQAFISIKNKFSLEYITEDLKVALKFLDELLGKNFSEELLERIFTEFCIGK